MWNGKAAILKEKPIKNNSTPARNNILPDNAGN
jgi:hypothetical protein